MAKNNVHRKSYFGFEICFSISRVLIKINNLKKK
jgi:hypothetical protein